MPRNYGQGFLNVLKYQDDMAERNQKFGAQDRRLDLADREMSNRESNNALVEKRYDYKVGQQNALNRKNTVTEQQEYVSGVMNRLGEVDENIRAQTWPMIVDDYQRRFNEPVPDHIKQYSPELFAKMQAAYGGQEEEQTVGQRDFRSMTEGFSPEEIATSRRIKAGLDPRAVGSSSQTIPLAGMTDLVAGSEATIAGAKERATAGVKEETGAGIKEAEKTGALVAANNMQTFESANNAVENIEKIDELINQITDSEAITGFGAELFKNVERIKAKIGSDVSAGKVTDTEILDAMMGSEVFPLIKALGIGARGMDTPAERKFLRQVMTGQIDLNRDTLLRMAKLRRKVATRAIKRYNSRVENGSLNNFFKHSGIPKAMLEIKEAKPNIPKGVTEEDITETMKIHNMTRKQVLQKLRGQ